MNPSSLVAARPPAPPGRRGAAGAPGSASPPRRTRSTGSTTAAPRTQTHAGKSVEQELELPFGICLHRFLWLKTSGNISTGDIGLCDYHGTGTNEAVIKSNESQSQIRLQYRVLVIGKTVTTSHKSQNPISPVSCSLMAPLSHYKNSGWPDKNPGRSIYISCTLLSTEKESVCSAHMATSPPSTSSFMAGVTVNPLSSSNLYRSFSYCICQPKQMYLY